MHDRLDDAWIDALSGRADPDATAAVAARLAADPAAAAAFDGWRRLAAAVEDAAAARGAAPPPLDAVLAAIRAPAASTLSATAHDALGRATVRRLAAQPVPAFDAARPVSGWIVAAAAVAAALVVALWPTPAGPLGRALLAAIDSEATGERVGAPPSPTVVARRSEAGARLRVGPAAAGTSASATTAARAGGAGTVDLDADGPGPDGRSPGAVAADSATARAAARRTAAVRVALAAAPPPAGPAGPSGPAPVGGYPAPGGPTSAYPAPPAPGAAGRSPGRRPPSKPAPRPSDTPPASPTAVPTAPPPTATAAPAATPTAAAAPAVVGVVSGADGGGRAQVRVAAYRDDDQPIGQAWVETFSPDATGRYTLTLSPGTWRLYAEAPGHRPQWWPGADRPSGGAAVTVADGPIVIDWRLAAVAEDDGLLVGRAGPHALVRAVPAGSDPAAVAGPSALADASGHFALPLPAGGWVVARSADGREHGWERLPDAVTIAPGTTTTADWP